MCSKSCLDFGKANLFKEDIAGKAIIELGAIDVNGSLRSLVKEFNPQKYVGVDIEAGSGVDVVCSVYELISQFGKESFDVIISTEMMEHIQDWRLAVSQIKGILKPNGLILITTRSKGFQYHGYPYDFWRFEIEDMKVIFSDMKIEVLETDKNDPGVFIKVRKPDNFIENNLSDYPLYSIVINDRSKEIEFSSFENFLVKCRAFFIFINRKLNNAKSRFISRS